MGLIGAAAGLGVMLGPAVGGLLQPVSLSAPGFVAAGLCALNGTAACSCCRSRGRVRQAASVGARPRRCGLGAGHDAQPLSLLLSVYFLGITSFAAMTALLALYFEREFGIGAQEMGLLFAIAGGVTVVVRGLVLGVLVRRFGEVATVRLGVVALGLAFLVLPWCRASAGPWRRCPSTRSARARCSRRSRR
jgi:hypothetical protein